MAPAPQTASPARPSATDQVRSHLAVRLSGFPLITGRPLSPARVEDWLAQGWSREAAEECVRINAERDAQGRLPGVSVAHCGARA